MTRRSRLGVILALAMATSCGSEGAATSSGSGGPPPGGAGASGTGGEAAAGEVLTATQRAFLDARGTPAIYTIVFADEELGDAGRPAAGAPRRLESWTWLDHHDTLAVFDSGYFVQEQPFRSAVTTAPLSPFSPGAFRAGMTPADVEALVGGDGEREESDFAGSRLLVLRYAPREMAPPHTFAFLDGRLASVNVGYQMRTP